MAISNGLTRRAFLGQAVTIGAVGLAAPRLLSKAATAAPAGSKRTGYQIGCYTRPWGTVDYRLALDAIVEAGFKYAGLMTTSTKGWDKKLRRSVIDSAISIEEAQEVGEELKKRGLAVPSIYGGGIPVAKSVQAGIEGLRKLIDNCAVVGCKSLLMGGTNERLYNAYYKVVSECCDYAAEKGMTITVKPHGGNNATGPQCRKICEVVGHKNFGIWYDPGNIYYYSEGKINPVDDAATVDGLVKGMCIKDFTLKPKRDVMVTPGEGMVDFPAVLARLAKGGFTSGALVVETVARGELPQILQEATKARKFVEELVGRKA